MTIELKKILAEWRMLEASPPGSMVTADPKKPLTVSSPAQVSKPPANPTRTAVKIPAPPKPEAPKTGLNAIVKQIRSATTPQLPRPIVPKVPGVAITPVANPSKPIDPTRLPVHTPAPLGPKKPVAAAGINKPPGAVKTPPSGLGI